MPCVIIFLIWFKRIAFIFGVHDVCFGTRCLVLECILSTLPRPLAICYFCTELLEATKSRKLRFLFYIIFTTLKTDSPILAVAIVSDIYNFLISVFVWVTWKIDKVTPFVKPYDLWDTHCNVINHQQRNRNAFECFLVLFITTLCKHIYIS